MEDSEQGFKTYQKNRTNSFLSFSSKINQSTSDENFFSVRTSPVFSYSKIKLILPALLTLFSFIIFLFIANNTSYAQQNIRIRFGSPNPVMGWSSWSFLRETPNADKMKAQADALVKSGLASVGYRYVNLDDFYYLGSKANGPQVDEFGRWVTDPLRFPPKGNEDGMEVMADYVHSLGLKFGIYLTPGIPKEAVKGKTKIKGTPFTADQIAIPKRTEHNYNFGEMVAIDFNKPGAQEYINSLADRFAKWGIDFIKFDGMTNRNSPDIKAWSHAIQQSGRNMVLDITQGSFNQLLSPVLMQYADQWEFAPDIECYECEPNGSSYPLTSWNNVAKRFDYVSVWQPYSIHGGYNDYDAIEIGNGNNNGLTVDERKTQISLWALGASPLILGVDLTHLDQSDLKLLKNEQIIAVDQDGIAAKRILLSESTQPVFAKTEKNGDVILGLFNMKENPEKISIESSVIGLPLDEKGYALSNLWEGTTVNSGRYISATVPPHGVVLYRIKSL